MDPKPSDSPNASNKVSQTHLMHSLTRIESWNKVRKSTKSKEQVLEHDTRLTETYDPKYNRERDKESMRSR
ncbi:hypothetical protein TNCV_3016471 [Trichonephila clavipes]|nr:hypothetical protein TNCV_3016471 [Trichonephila clavipes]